MNDGEKLITQMAKDLTRPEWVKVKTDLIGVKNYIELLEAKIVELSGEIDKYKRTLFVIGEKERLTTLWARGEIEN